MKKITIAIDGFSSCGKSTMAKDLAQEIGYIYIDSGAMYRAVTLYCIQNDLFKPEGIDTETLRKQIDQILITFHLNPQTKRPQTYLNGKNVEKEIRTMEVSSKVSLISTIDFVRQALVAQQQEMGKAKGIVMDGRDIGTVIMTDADIKFFMVATPEIRAKRRFKELCEKGIECSYDDILADMIQRDKNDRERDIAPAVPAEDAIHFDNSDMNIEETLDAMIKIIDGIKK